MKYKIAFFVVLAAMSGQVLAQDRSLSLKLGLLGAGIEYGQAWGDRLAVRIGVHGSSLSIDESVAGIDYNIDIDWDSLSLALDIYPRTRAFRLSVGMLSNDNSLYAQARPTGIVDIGGDLFPGNLVGTLTGRIGFDSSAPFAGLGWDWSKNRRFGVSFDMGLLSQGSPRVSLTADGLLASDPSFQADLVAEQAQMQDSVDDLDLFPFAALGLVFRF